MTNEEYHKRLDDALAKYREVYGNFTHSFGQVLLNELKKQIEKDIKHENT